MSWARRFASVIRPSARLTTMASGAVSSRSPGIPDDSTDPSLPYPKYANSGYMRLNFGHPVVVSSPASLPIDPNRPSAARIYDAFLGGTHNFASDRAVVA